jgi:Fic family protein
MPMPRGRPSRTSIYRRLSEAIDDLNQRLGGLPTPAEAEDIWAELWHQEAHHSTAIEGNTLVLSEVEKLLEEGRAVGEKELKEYMEVVGYGAAAKWVYSQALEPGGWSADQLLTIHEIRSVHSQTMTPVWNVAPHPHATSDESPGNWRQHQIQAFQDGFKPPSFVDIDPLIGDWVREVNELSEINDDPLPERWAHIHNMFERIHPFLDGNGRTGRLLLNLILVRLGYPPAIIFKGQRSRYLAAMRKADAGDLGPLGELLARAVTDNLYRFVVPAIAGPARLVPLASLANPMTEFSAIALRNAANRGRLRAQKSPTGAWLSSKNWVDEYARSKFVRTVSTSI